MATQAPNAELNAELVKPNWCRAQLKPNWCSRTGAVHN
jgi:hypothetical protein